MERATALRGAHRRAPTCSPAPSTYDWPGLEAKLDLLLASLSFRKWIPQRFHDLLGSISPDCLTLEIYLKLDSFANVPSCQTVVWAVKHVKKK